MNSFVNVAGMKHFGMDGISTRNPAAGKVFIHPLAISVQYPPLLPNHFPFLPKSKLGNTKHQKFPLGNGINPLVTSPGPTNKF